MFRRWSTIILLSGTVIWSIAYFKNWFETNECDFFSFLGFILKRVNHINVFSLLFFVYALMFFLFSIIKNPVLFILPVETLNGIIFALFYSRAISYANFSTPAGAEGTFQLIIGTTLTGLGLSLHFLCNIFWPVYLLFHIC